MTTHQADPADLSTDDEDMLSDDMNIAAQLQTYIAAFSPAAAEVLDAFHYQQTITRLDKAGVL